MASKILVDELAPQSHATDVTLATGKNITGANTQFKITGGSSGNIISTDGVGALTWGAPPNNNPHFYAYSNTDQTGLADDVPTKVACNTVITQTGSTYDNATHYRWTPAVAGTYLITGQAELSLYSTASDWALNTYLYIYKNGVEEIKTTVWQSAVSQNHAITGSVIGVIVLSITDYIELWAKMDTYTAATWQIHGSSVQASRFMAHRLAI
jgi:hypothetical protein